MVGEGGGGGAEQSNKCCSSFLTIFLDFNKIKEKTNHLYGSSRQGLQSWVCSRARLE